MRKFDDGGWLPPHSATLAINGTDRYEPVGPPPTAGASGEDSPPLTEAEITNLFEPR